MGQQAAGAVELAPERGAVGVLRGIARRIAKRIGRIDWDLPAFAVAGDVERSAGVAVQLQRDSSDEHELDLVAGEDAEKLAVAWLDGAHASCSCSSCGRRVE